MYIVYEAIIAPHFEYCATLLMDMGETQLDKLQVPQSRAIRVILQCDRYTKVEHMYVASVAVHIHKTEAIL